MDTVNRSRLWPALKLVLEIVAAHGTRQQVRVQLDTAHIKRMVEAIARDNGRQFRLVALPLQATATGAALLELMTSGFASRMGARRFWGGLYALARLGIVALLLVRMPQRFETYAALAGVVGGFALIQLIVEWIWRRGPKPASEVE